MIAVEFEKLVRVCGSKERAVRVLLGYEERASSEERKAARPLRKELISVIERIEKDISLSAPKKKSRGLSR